MAVAVTTTSALSVGLVAGIQPANAASGTTPGPSTAASVRVVPAVPSQLQVRTTRLVAGLSEPTAVVAANEGTSRLFVAERAGRVRLVVGGRLKSRSYLDLRSRVGSGGSEQGLLGLAFSPNFKSRKTLFLTYTNRSGALVLARVSAATWRSNRAKAATLRTILTVPHPEHQNHNGGSITFGADGYLYLGTGDGGGGGDPFRHAQRLSSLQGKILRIDVRRPCGSKRYCVPATNPYVRSGRPASLVWASGLRNPWRITTDRATGDLWIGDVGQSRWEEIDRLPRGLGGRNLGWSCREGNEAYNADQCPVPARYVGPVTTLCHPDSVSGCPANLGAESITGGYVYRGRTYPVLEGTYLFADFIDGNLYAYRAGATAKVGALGYVSSFGQTNSGELVAVSFDGSLYRVSATRRA